MTCPHRSPFQPRARGQPVSGRGNPVYGTVPLLQYVAGRVDGETRFGNIFESIGRETRLAFCENIEASLTSLVSIAKK